MIIRNLSMGITGQPPVLAERKQQREELLIQGRIPPGGNLERIERTL
jgi:hypothetical protein